MPVSERLRKAGFSDADLDAILARPDALQRAFQVGLRRYLIPIIPGLIKRLSQRVEGGNASAESVALSLLGDKSPVKEAGGMDMSAVDDTALSARASQLSEQLANLVEALSASKRKSAP